MDKERLSEMLDEHDRTLFELEIGSIEDLPFVIHESGKEDLMRDPYAE